MALDLYIALVVVAGTAANVLYACMFLARVLRPRWSRPLGFTGTAMALPMVAAALVALSRDADPWLVALPAVFVAFAVVEVYVDVLAGTDVRSTRWLWPYLAAFYLAQWAAVGAAFIASTPGGAAVLVSYFICLVAAAWSYRKVGHGQRPDPISSAIPATPTPRPRTSATHGEK